MSRVSSALFPGRPMLSSQASFLAHRVRLVCLLALVSLFLAAPLAASDSASPYRIPWENGNIPCWDAAGAYHGVDPWLLYAIAKVESSYNPRAVNGSNSNGTRDIGLMQINSVHLPELRRHGISEEQLFNACASTYIGAWIMAKNIKRHGYTWQAIAVYNVGSLNTPARQRIGRRYAEKVYAAHAQVARAQARPAPPRR